MKKVLRAISVLSGGWLCVALPLPIAAQQSARGSVEDSTAVMRNLDAVYAGFRAAYSRLDAAAVGSLYTDDALYLAGDAGLRKGAAAIQRHLKEFFSSVRGDSARLELRFRILSRTVAPGLATDVGYYRLVRVRGTEQGRPSLGRFVTVLRAGPDGRWRIAVDSYTDATAAEYEQAPSREP